MDDKNKGLSSKWQWYNGKLKEVEESLFNLKEQFKMGLLSSTTELKEELRELEDSIPIQAPTTSE